MVMLDRYFRFLFAFWIFASAVTLSHSDVNAQATLKKIRLGIAATSVGFLPIYTAYHRGFYKDEGIDLEIILMSLAVANNAFFKGEIDYSAGLTGLALAAVRNYPAKILIFTVAKPLQSFVSRKEIKEPRDLRGKKVAGSSPGGIVCLTGLGGPQHAASFDIATLNQSLVLENRVVFGTVNANRHHYEDAAWALARADRGWLERVVTRKVPLEKWDEAYEKRPDDVKTVLQFED